MLPVVVASAHLISEFDAGYREGIEVAPYFAKRTQMVAGPSQQAAPDEHRSKRQGAPAGAARPLSEQSTISRAT
jgi:hypothetical protein